MAASEAHEVTELIRAPITFEAVDRTRVHAPMVAAEIAGVTTLLVLDTGSDVHLLTNEFADRVGLRVEPGEEGTDHAGTSMPSALVEAVEIRLGATDLTIDEVVAIPAPPPFPGWGVGGILSPQRLHPTAQVVVDLIIDELLVIDGDDEALAAWVADRHPELVTLVLDRVGGEGTVIVQAAVKPFPSIPTLLNTRGRGTEFSRASVPALSGAALERLGSGVSGSDVLGMRVGTHVLAVDKADLRIESLAVRDSMEDPQGMVGMDVLRGTALVCGANPEGRVLWQVPAAAAHP